MDPEIGGADDLGVIFVSPLQDTSNNLDRGGGIQAVASANDGSFICSWKGNDVTLVIVLKLLMNSHH